MHKMCHHFWFFRSHFQILHQISIKFSGRVVLAHTNRVQKTKSKSNDRLQRYKQITKTMTPKMRHLASCAVTFSVLISTSHIRFASNFERALLQLRSKCLCQKINPARPGSLKRRLAPNILHPVCTFIHDSIIRFTYNFLYTYAHS